jgi:hypothetical protein
MRLLAASDSLGIYSLDNRAIRGAARDQLASFVETRRRIEDATQREGPGRQEGDDRLYRLERQV